jgi:hypothetical protein
LFSDSIEEEVAKWTKAGYTASEARQFVAWKKLGVQPEGKQVQVSEVQKAQSSSLFGTLTEMDMCNQLQRVSGVQEVLGVYRRFYIGDEKDPKNDLYQELKVFAEKVESLPTEHQSEILKTMENVLCELQRLEK